MLVCVQGTKVINQPAFAASAPASFNAGYTATDVFLLCAVDHCEQNIVMLLVIEAEKTVIAFG